MTGKPQTSATQGNMNLFLFKSNASVPFWVALLQVLIWGPTPNESSPVQDSQCFPVGLFHSGQTEGQEYRSSVGDMCGPGSGLQHIGQNAIGQKLITWTELPAKKAGK